MTYPTLDDLKTYMGSASALSDNPHGLALSGAIAWSERYTGRKFVAEAGTRMFRYDSYHWIPKRRRLAFYDDLMSVTTFTLPNGTVTTDYALLGNKTPYTALRVDNTVPVVAYEPTNVWFTLEGMWGYSTDCPDDVFQAILQLAQHQLTVRQGRSSHGSAERSGMVMAVKKVPTVVREVLRVYRR
jgi:hypothetical protein